MMAVKVEAATAVVSTEAATRVGAARVEAVRVVVSSVDGGGGEGGGGEVEAVGWMSKWQWQASRELREAFCEREQKRAVETAGVQEKWLSSGTAGGGWAVSANNWDNVLQPEPLDIGSIDSCRTIRLFYNRTRFHAITDTVPSVH